MLTPDGRRLYVANEVVRFHVVDGVPTPFGRPLAMRGPSLVLPVP